MEKTIIKTSTAPAAIGPYSQAVINGALVFVSGQIPLDPETGEVVSGSIQIQAKQALTNLSQILRAAGTSLERVVKTTVFIRDMAHFQEMNAVYAEFFKHNPPARSCVEVSNLPRNVDFEIEAIAAV